MSIQKISPQILETYLTVIRNSVGSNLWRNFYAKVNGEQKDIMRNGELSCAFFVSSICVLFNSIQKIHGTVDGLVKDLESSGWKKIKKPVPGSIVVWAGIKFSDGDVHRHIGFYGGNDMAVSNSSKLGHPVLHHWKFGKQKRKIESIWFKRIA